MDRIFRHLSYPVKNPRWDTTSKLNTRPASASGMMSAALDVLDLGDLVGRSFFTRTGRPFDVIRLTRKSIVIHPHASRKGRNYSIDREQFQRAARNHPTRESLRGGVAALWEVDRIPRSYAWGILSEIRMEASLILEPGSTRREQVQNRDLLEEEMVDQMRECWEDDLELERARGLFRIARLTLDSMEQVGLFTGWARDWIRIVDEGPIHHYGLEEFIEQIVTELVGVLEEMAPSSDRQTLVDRILRIVAECDSETLGDRLDGALDHLLPEDDEPTWDD